MDVIAGPILPLEMLKDRAGWRRVILIIVSKKSKISVRPSTGWGHSTLFGSLCKIFLKLYLKRNGYPGPFRNPRVLFFVETMVLVLITRPRWTLVAVYRTVVAGIVYLDFTLRGATLEQKLPNGKTTVSQPTKTHVNLCALKPIRNVIDTVISCLDPRKVVVTWSLVRTGAR